MKLIEKYVRKKKDRREYEKYEILKYEVRLLIVVLVIMDMKQGKSAFFASVELLASTDRFVALRRA